jgi:hypothetical protein
MLGTEVATKGVQYEGRKVFVCQREAGCAVPEKVGCRWQWWIAEV